MSMHSFSRTTVSRVNGSHVSRLINHLSHAFRSNAEMRPDPRKVLSDNLRRLIGDRSQSEWAAAHGIDKKPIQRALAGQHAATIDTIEAIAKAAGILPWQLLVPDLDPSNPPVVAITQAERQLYRRLRSAFQELPPMNGDH